MVSYDGILKVLSRIFFPLPYRSYVYGLSRAPLYARVRHIGQMHVLIYCSRRPALITCISTKLTPSFATIQKTALGFCTVKSDSGTAIDVIGLLHLTCQFHIYRSAEPNTLMRQNARAILSSCPHTTDIIHPFMSFQYTYTMYCACVSGVCDCNSVHIALPSGIRVQLYMNAILAHVVCQLKCNCHPVGIPIIERLYNIRCKCLLSNDVD